ncbi:MAG: hypothetical protein V1723_03575 [Candidatus Uhrbacteria bacterium]
MRTIRVGTFLLRLLVDRLPYFITIVVIVTAAAVGLIAQRYVYGTIANAQATAILRATVTVDDLEREQFSAVVARFAELTNLPDLTARDIRDPFTARPTTGRAEIKNQD